MIDVKKLGQGIKLLREQKGLTLNQLAQMTGERTQHISNFENGSRIASVDKLNKIYEVLGYDLEVVINKV